MSKTREVRPFGARDKFGYLFGDLANDFSFIFASTYVMVFYTKVMGISGQWSELCFLLLVVSMLLQISVWDVS